MLIACISELWYDSNLVCVRVFYWLLVFPKILFSIIASHHHIRARMCNCAAFYRFSSHFYRMEISNSKIRIVFHREYQHIFAAIIERNSNEQRKRSAITTKSAIFLVDMLRRIAFWWNSGKVRIFTFFISIRCEIDPHSILSTSYIFSIGKYFPYKFNYAFNVHYFKLIIALYSLHTLDTTMRLAAALPRVAKRVLRMWAWGRMGYFINRFYFSIKFQLLSSYKIYWSNPTSSDERAVVIYACALVGLLLYSISYVCMFTRVSPIL